MDPKRTSLRDALPRLGIWILHLPAAPHPLLLRRDRPFDPAAPVADVPDVVRYVAAARRSLKGPLALEIDGPGDALASPETVLRALSILREHHPDVVTGLVIDGPLMAEYAEELEAFGLSYLVVRRDAATEATARRLVDGARYRGETIERDGAARMMLDEGIRAIHLARRHEIPVAVRTSLLPNVNAWEIEEIARQVCEAGAERMDVVAHDPVAGAPLSHPGTPTAEEVDEARAIIDAVFDEDPAHRGPSALDWLCPQRMQKVDLDALDALDVLRTLPDPHEDPEPAPLLPPRRAQLIAVATADGTLVDTPLETAHALRLYAVTERAIRYVGSRPLPLDPRRRHDGVGDARIFLQALVGCRSVVATRIPPRAVTLLGAVGIRGVAQGGRVNEVLDRVARGAWRQAGS